MLGGRSPAQAFLLVMVGNLAAVAAGTATAWPRGRWPVAGTALAGLAVAVALEETATVAAGLLGQAATAVLLVVIVRRATEPAGETPGRPAGLGAVAAAWTAGMGLFVLLVFAYYAAYDVVLPAGNGLLRRWRPPCRAGRRAGHAVPGKCVESASSRRPSRLRPAQAPVAVEWRCCWSRCCPGWRRRPGRGRAGVGRAPAGAGDVLQPALRLRRVESTWKRWPGIEATGAEVVGLQEVSAAGT